MINDIIDIISKYNTITIFRHVNPDMDAIGSQFALKYWIETNFKDKKVYALGDENIFLNYTCDNLDDLSIKNSLAIIVDTANKERIDDKRALNANFIIKIDHHPNNDSYGDLNFVNENSAATCQILSEYFLNVKDRYTLNTEICETLYKGILTDTLCFKTSNTTSDTLFIASNLAKFNIDIPKINQEVFNISLNKYNCITYLRSKIQFNENKKLAFIILDSSEINSFVDISSNEIRSFMSYELSNIKEIEIWCTFTQNKNDFYDASIRSKSIIINKIANKYNGGGHNNASGVKNLNNDSLKSLLSDLEKLVYN